ncbi:MAG: hypothetical protein KZQ66_11340 [Candidatus Thiodiazotropha sp. (ex Lucinoma aequizonata)]|nr:hypothetical protein [Candidatus Thiodiazotropha sp. (ex Lucinoma aequizonata)]MCU7887342.1 hypothetical protein [Candidatus Thiodiazotropha sp. (ex Lucinoma aequizonata)]MCU7896034.1 hypothetical protein [Candidatus Thiodiazotropha sp. (ex Lucinoma aequizonata)]MCU7898031.1 hypothetical protein [Candidatus Thiodiazotropha sp. (ex Lucinoma aequizonata)]MCU7902513.1 hypothetical protein [Candidatus Thiodiazotropha sp. (ex Lucinoma aequizonata)]
MGNVVNLIGRGGQCFAEEVLGWNCVTIRKGSSRLFQALPLIEWVG